MLVRKEVSNATDLDLLTVLIGDRRKATKVFCEGEVVALFPASFASGGERRPFLCRACQRLRERSAYQAEGSRRACSEEPCRAADEP